MSTLEVLGLNIAVVLVLLTGLWGVSVAMKDTSIVDIFWGSGFVVVAKKCSVVYWPE